jgi:predicted phage terminase large subunit-like protein
MQTSRSPQSVAAAAKLAVLKTRTWDSLALFCRTILREKFPTPMAAFQGAMTAQALRLRGGTRDVVEVPRGHGKSTLRSFATPLWLAVTGRKGHITIISDSLAQAREHVRNIADELQKNIWLRATYGDFGSTTARQWSASLLELKNGAIIRAMGKGQSARGMIRAGRRPDLVIVDDPQRLAGVINHDQREKDWRWLLADVIPALDSDKGDLLINGTRLHRECISARAAGLAAMTTATGGKANAWTASRYEAIEDGKPLWPGRYTMEALQAIRDDIGPSAWAREFRNAPTEDETAMFRPEWLVFDDPPAGLTYERVVYCDPAAGTEHGDYSAIVDVVRCVEPGVPVHPLVGITWVVGAWLLRETPRVALARAARIAANANGVPVARAVGVEEDTYGELGRSLREAVAALTGSGFPGVPVRTVRHTGNKFERIFRLQPHVETGRLRFATKLAGGPFVNQLLDIPTGSHDDGPDALEGAWSLLDTGRVRVRRA